MISFDIITIIIKFIIYYNLKNISVKFYLNYMFSIVAQKPQKTNQISKELFYKTYPTFDWKFYSQYIPGLL